MPAMIETQGNALTYETIEADAGLKAALAMSRADLVDFVRDSDIRGRGGAGFPTGMKWGFCAAEKADQKYLICNADEGEPGTFKDRVILTRFADLVIEGMTIGGRAIGATLGIIYLRAEYTYLRPHLNEVIQRRRGQGLLGHDIQGVEGFDFDILVAMGAGAYVCGEETALIESLEGFRGEPRNRPPFPVVAGLLNNPTVVNNVETLASIAAILAKGADWFKEFGTDKSTGYKLFSISGDCEKPGVYEFPWGITDRRPAQGGRRRGRQGRPDRRRQRHLRARRRLQPRARLRRHPHRRLDHGDRPGSGTSSTSPRTSSSSSSRRAAASARPAVSATRRCSEPSSCSRRAPAHPSSSPTSRLSARP